MKANKGFNQLTDLIMKIEAEVEHTMLFDNYNLDSLQELVRLRFEQNGIAESYPKRHDDVMNIIYGAQNKILQMGL